MATNCAYCACGRLTAVATSAIVTALGWRPIRMTPDDTYPRSHCLAPQDRRPRCRPGGARSGWPIPPVRSDLVGEADKLPAATQPSYPHLPPPPPGVYEHNLDRLTNRSASRALAILSLSPRRRYQPGDQQNSTPSTPRCSRVAAGSPPVPLRSARAPQPGRPTATLHEKKSRSIRQKKRELYAKLAKLLPTRACDL